MTKKTGTIRDQRRRVAALIPPPADDDPRGEICILHRIVVRPTKGTRAGAAFVTVAHDARCGR